MFLVIPVFVRHYYNQVNVQDVSRVMSSVKIDYDEHILTM